MRCKIACVNATLEVPGVEVDEVDHFRKFSNVETFKIDDVMSGKNKQDRLYREPLLKGKAL